MYKTKKEGKKHAKRMKLQNNERNQGLSEYWGIPQDRIRLYSPSIEFKSKLAIQPSTALGAVFTTHNTYFNITQDPIFNWPSSIKLCYS